VLAGWSIGDLWVLAPQKTRHKADWHASGDFDEPRTEIDEFRHLKCLEAASRVVA